MKILYRFAICLIVSFMVGKPLVSKGSEVLQINQIYSHLQVEVGKVQEVSVTFVIGGGSILKNFQYYLDVPSQFEVISIDVPQNGFFSESDFYIKDFTQNRIMIVAVKDSPYNQYQTAICTIKFKVKQSVSDVSKVIDGTFVVFDKMMNELSYVRKSTEEMRVDWTVSSYAVEVNSNLPNVKGDIEISNRNESDYLIEVISNEVDISILGVQLLKVCVYDLTNGAVYYLAKIINVIDSTKPIVQPLVEKVSVKASQLSSVDNVIRSSVSVSDNYDTHLEVSYKLFDRYLNEVEKGYFNNNLNGYVEYLATDRSGNKSEKVLLQFCVVDDVSPTISVLNTVNVNDVEIDDFDFLKLISITDSYDPDPRIVLMYTETLPLKEFLQENNVISFSYFGVDLTGNKTNEITVIITLIDTTPPTIQIENQIVIDHGELIDKETFLKEIYELVIVNDNLDKDPKVNVFCYDELDRNIDVNSFFNLLLKGLSGTVKLQAIDKSGNYSDKVDVLIIVVDSCKPSIKIQNIEDGRKYFVINDVGLLITDNVEGEITVIMYLDDVLYHGGKIDSIGDHHLLVQATDRSGNVNILEVNFAIIKDNFIGCLDDSECYWRNYKQIVYIVAGLLCVVVTLTAMKIIYKKRRRNHQIA